MVPFDHNSSSPATDTYPSFSSVLLTRAQAGDGDAIESFVELYGPLVYRWCRKSLQPADACDAAQEVFRGVWLGIANFSRDCQNSTSLGWLRRITQFKIADRFRDHQKVPMADGGTDAHKRFEIVPDGAAAVTDEDIRQSTLDADRRQLLHLAMKLVASQVQERTWEAFLRTAVQGSYSAEVAAALGMTTTAVRNARFRVIRKLRNLLPEDLLDDLTDGNPSSG